jgi:hypothetical protein
MDIGDIRDIRPFWLRRWVLPEGRPGIAVVGVPGCGKGRRDIFVVEADLGLVVDLANYYQRFSLNSQFRLDKS